MTTTLAIFAFVSGAVSADHLESVEKDLTLTDMHRAYHHLWERKVLERGAIVQFVSAPGGPGPEIGISVLQTSERDRDKKTGFKLVVKETSSSLWSVIVAKHEGTRKSPNVDVKKCEIPLPESTGLAVRRAWLVMLQKIDPAPERMVLDSTSEMFFAKADDGRMLRARLPLTDDLGPNSKRLFEIANLLYHCCDETEGDRARDLRQIEDLAAAITQK